jgi:hypothetical protein
LFGFHIPNALRNKTIDGIKGRDCNRSANWSGITTRPEVTTSQTRLNSYKQLSTSATQR